MTYAPEGENTRAEDTDGVAESLETGSVLDYLWFTPEEEQAPLQASTEASAIIVPSHSAVPEEGKGDEKGGLSSVLNNYNGWLSSIADA